MTQVHIVLDKDSGKIMAVYSSPGDAQIDCTGRNYEERRNSRLDVPCFNVEIFDVR